MFLWWKWLWSEIGMAVSKKVRMSRWFVADLKQTWLSSHWIMTHFCGYSPRRLQSLSFVAVVVKVGDGVKSQVVRLFIYVTLYDIIWHIIISKLSHCPRASIVLLRGLILKKKSFLRFFPIIHNSQPKQPSKTSQKNHVHRAWKPGSPVPF